MAAWGVAMPWWLMWRGSIDFVICDTLYGRMGMRLSIMHAMQYWCTWIIIYFCIWLWYKFHKVMWKNFIFFKEFINWWSKCSSAFITIFFLTNVTFFNSFNSNFVSLFALIICSYADLINIRDIGFNLYHKHYKTQTGKKRSTNGFRRSFGRREDVMADILDSWINNCSWNGPILSRQCVATAMVIMLTFLQRATGNSSNNN